MSRMTKKPYIDQALINRLFYDQPKNRRFPLWQFVSAFILVTTGFYFALNAPAFSQQFRYWFEHDIKASQRVQPALITTPHSADGNLQPASHVAQVLTQLETELANNTLWIPKLNIKAPLIWDITATGDTNADILKSLEQGVVRYPDTALPDQVGNVFLTGHSSNYWWEKGQYKTVFALLDKLVVGDTLIIQYENVRYTYKVSGQKVIKPTETSVLAATNHATLSLMTCTPVGTSLLRRVVTAELVSPNSLNKKQPSQPSSRVIQAIR